MALGRRDRPRRYLTLLGSETRATLQVAHYGLGQIARPPALRALRALEDRRFGWARCPRRNWTTAWRSALSRRDGPRSSRPSPGTSVLAPTALGARAPRREDAHNDAAIDALSAAIIGSFGDFLPLTRLGDVLHGRGDEEAAIESYQEALEIFPAFTPAQERLKRALTAQGRWEEVAGTSEAADLGLAPWVWDRLLDGDLPYHELVAERDSIPVGDARRVVLSLVQLRAGFPAGAIAWSKVQRRSPSPGASPCGGDDARGARRRRRPTVSHSGTGERARAKVSRP